MEFTDEKKRIVREAVRIIHDTCAERNDYSKCPACSFWENKSGCVFRGTPEDWPLSKKPSTDWNYFKECEEN